MDSSQPMHQTHARMAALDMATRFELPSNKQLAAKDIMQLAALFERYILTGERPAEPRDVTPMRSE